MSYKKRQKIMRILVIFVLVAFVLTSVLATLLALLG